MILLRVLVSQKIAFRYSSRHLPYFSLILSPPNSTRCCAYKTTTITRMGQFTLNTFPSCRLAQHDICITATAILVLNLGTPWPGETLLAIRSRRYTTVGPVQSAVCNFGQVVGSPCLPVTARSRARRWSPFTLHGGGQTIGGTPLCLLVNLVHARQNSMDSRWKSVSAPLSFAGGFRTCPRLRCLFRLTCVFRAFL